MCITCSKSRYILTKCQDCCTVYNEHGSHIYINNCSFSSSTFEEIGNLFECCCTVIFFICKTAIIIKLMKWNNTAIVARTNDLIVCLQYSSTVFFFKKIVFYFRIKKATYQIIKAKSAIQNALSPHGGRWYSIDCFYTTCMSRLLLSIDKQHIQDISSFLNRIYIVCIK